jgi:predicted nucleic acid-binding protein
MIYLDTNILVSLRIGDGNTVIAEEWFAQQPAPFAISAWVIAEFIGHVGLRVRRGEVSPRNSARIIEAFDEAVATNLSMLKADDSAILHSSMWLRDAHCSLQPADALHLAIAHTAGATTLATFDERFAKAAQKLKLTNLKVVLIGEKARRVEQTRTAHKVTQPRTRAAVAVITTKTTTKNMKKVKR